MSPASLPPAPPTQWVGVSSDGRTYEVVSCIFYTLSAVAVGLRITARLQQFNRLFIDDYMCIIAQIFAFGMMAIAIIFTEKFAMGWHIVDVPVAQWTKYFQLFYSAEICYTIVSTFYKLAVVFLYLRIFGEYKFFKYASWVMLAISICWGISQTITIINQCHPISKAWNPLLPGICLNTQDFILGNGIVNLLIDAIIICLPLPLVWRLHLDWKRKLALTGMFMLGSVVCIASILRITTILPLDLTDGTFTLFGLALWSNIEPAVGIIGACLPTLRQFFFSSTAEHSVSASAPKSRFLSYLAPSRGGGKSALVSASVRDDTADRLTGWKPENIEMGMNGRRGEHPALRNGWGTPSPAKDSLENSDVEAQAPARVKGVSEW